MNGKESEVIVRSGKNHIVSVVPHSYTGHDGIVLEPVAHYLQYRYNGDSEFCDLNGVEASP